MHLPHRWEDCSAEWRPEFDRGQKYWTCAGCRASYPHDEDVSLAAVEENNIGRTLRFLTTAGMRLLRHETGS